jgi:hypothetical protein
LISGEREGEAPHIFSNRAPTFVNPALAQETRESIDCCKLAVEHSMSIMLYNLISSAKSFIETVSLHAAVVSLICTLKTE